MKNRRTAFAGTVGTELDPEFGARLDRFSEIAQLALMVYTPEEVRLFMTTPSPRFDGRTALDLLDAGETQRVLSALAADYEWLS
jgi:uncharacterized protein (DUF2384 family)